MDIFEIGFMDELNKEAVSPSIFYMLPNEEGKRYASKPVEFIQAKNKTILSRMKEGVLGKKEGPAPTKVSDLTGNSLKRVTAPVGASVPSTVFGDIAKGDAAKMKHGFDIEKGMQSGQTVKRSAIGAGEASGAKKTIGELAGKAGKAGEFVAKNWKAGVGLAGAGLLASAYLKHKNAQGQQQQVGYPSY